MSDPEGVFYMISCGLHMVLIVWGFKIASTVKIFLENNNKMRILGHFLVPFQSRGFSRTLRRLQRFKAHDHSDGLGVCF